MGFQRTDNWIETPYRGSDPACVHPVPAAAIWAHRAPRSLRMWACQGVRLRHTRAPLSGRQGASGVLMKRLNAIRSHHTHWSAPQDVPLTAVGARCAEEAWPLMTISVLMVPLFLRAAVDWAVRSQFWANFAQTKICYGARTRLSLRRTTTSSRARCSMLPNPKTQDLQFL